LVLVEVLAPAKTSSDTVVVLVFLPLTVAVRVQELSVSRYA